MDPHQAHLNVLTHGDKGVIPLCRILPPFGIYKLVCKHTSRPGSLPKDFQYSIFAPLIKISNEVLDVLEELS